MPEENQNPINQATPMEDDITSRLAWLREFRTRTKLAKAKQTQNELDNSSNEMFEQSLNVTNPELSRKYNQASQSTAVASMIKSYAEQNWDDWSDLNTPNEILAEYYRLNPDDETYNKITEFTKSDRDPEEFWREMGWVTTPIKEAVPETFMDKAKDSIVWPFARAVWTLGGIVGWLWEGIGDAAKRPWEFDQWQLERGYIDENWNPTDLNLKETIKRYGKFFGTLGNMIWDVVGWGFVWGAKWFTTHQEQEAIKDKVAEVAAAIINSEPWEKVQNMYNELDENQKQELKDWASIIDGLSDLPLSFFWGKVAKEWVKQTIKLWESELVEKSVKKVDDIVEKSVNKKLIKQKPENIKEIRSIANTIWQWEVKDIDNSVKAIKSIMKTSEPKEINNFIDLRKAWSKRADEIKNSIDANLSNEKYKDLVIKASDQKIVKVNWEDKGKVVEDAINDLLDVYWKQRKPDKMNEVLQFKEKFTTDWVSYKELNDFAREYGGVMDAWNKKNQLTTDVKVWTEETRSWIKDLIRERVPASEFKDLDAELGSVLNFNKLVDTTVEKVNNIEKKLRDKWFVEEAREAWSDFKSTIRWDLRGDTQTIYRIQENLPERLEIFNDLSKAIDRAETAEQTMEALKKAKQWIKGK